MRCRARHYLGNRASKPGGLKNHLGSFGPLCVPGRARRMWNVFCDSSAYTCAARHLVNFYVRFRCGRPGRYGQCDNASGDRASSVVDTARRGLRTRHIACRRAGRRGRDASLARRPARERGEFRAGVSQRIAGTSEARTARAMPALRCSPTHSGAAKSRGITVRWQSPRRHPP